MAGWSPGEATPLARRFVEEVDRHQVYGWAAPLLRWLSEHGTRPVIISGAPREILVEHVQHLGLADVEVHGLTLTLGDDGRYAGGVAANVGTDASKRKLIERLAATAGPVELGVGDSTSDLPILRAARRQLIVGDHARGLLKQFGPSAACVPNPGSATAQEMIDLVGLLTTS
jgi:phosphoserine phosphatase